MIYLKNSIVVNKPFDKVFQTAAAVAEWPEFLSSHKGMKIISQEREEILIEWKLFFKLKPLSLLIESTKEWQQSRFQDW
ncbi:MAG: hypothetical protein QME07_00685 [bacterium]|nr:hypothetical protein [bacterium]